MVVDKGDCDEEWWWGRRMRRMRMAKRFFFTFGCVLHIYVCLSIVFPVDALIVA